MIQITILTRKTILLSMVSFFIIQANAQDNAGQINGNVQLGGQYYTEDDKNSAQVPPQDVGFNSFGNLIYTKGNFSTGVRFESYEPALLGYPASPNTVYSGSGVGYRFARYSDEKFTVVMGNFYEQFGNGFALRAYEERNLGVDNSLDGFNVNYRPYKGIILKGVYGKQRLGFTDGTTKGPGIVRGGDVEVSLNDLLDSTFQSRTRITVGASLVSKYQQDLNPQLVLPENVSLYGGRININRGRVNIVSEYITKINDPSADNGYIYKPGHAFLFTNTYSTKGLGITLSAQFIDNMSFRSDRAAGFTDVLINYVPAVPRQHTYNLPATLYPYATQLNGEVGLTGEITYKFRKDTPIGGKYGTTFGLNSSFVHGLDSTHQNDLGTFGLREGYKVSPFSFNGKTYFRDVHLEMNKKLSKKVKLNAMLINFVYNIDVLQGKPGKAKVGSLIGITDMNLKLNKKHALRFELQGMMVGNFLMEDKKGHFQYLELDEELDQGHWTTAIVEYTYSPHWFVAVQDQFNFGNSTHEKLNYPLMSFGYTEGATRFMVTGGRQRAGLFCVGGVCRAVPASTGVSLTITSSF